MIVDLHGKLDMYIHLHADCIAVRGAKRSAFYDLTRSELIFFSSEYYEVLEFLGSEKIGYLLSCLECDEEKGFVIEFIDFLERNELIMFVKDPSVFPSIQEQWDVPATIQNAVIDVDAVYHDFNKIFSQLDELGCFFVQIRSFSNLLKLDDLHHIMQSSHHKSIQSVELVVKYDAAISDEAYIKFLESHPVVSSLILHSSPEERILAVDYGCNDESGRYIQKGIHVVSQCISSEAHCGIITVKALNAPSVDNFLETKLYNGCLNRKIAVDARGEIRNCPSMPQSYGNIKDTSLQAAILKAGFTHKWMVTKDRIAICKDCEFRYVCSDCRAYVESPDDIYSKPLKCGYNPYTCEWEEWSQNPCKQKAIEYYGMQHLDEKNNKPYRDE